jgi:gluconolactonase
MKHLLLTLLIYFFLDYAGWAQTNEAGKITRLHKAFDKIVATDAKPEKVAGGFLFTEGPLWHSGGFLIFSDIPANRIYQLDATGKAEVFLEKSGYTGAGSPTGEIGTNGLGYDQTGQLLLCQHGNRQLVRQGPDGKQTVLAEKMNGKRFNSPNDVVCRKDGTIYFTDPSWGLEKNSDKPLREIAYNGVYRLANGQVYVLDSTLVKPNGVALSPDGRTLYVADMTKKWYRYQLNADGTVKSRKVFFDASGINGSGHMDGMKVDVKGNVYGTGPDGVMVFTPAGEYLGAIQFAEIAANVGWGGSDGRTLYATCQTGIYRIKLKNRGLRYVKSTK